MKGHIVSEFIKIMDENQNLKPTFFEKVKRMFKRKRLDRKPMISSPREDLNFIDFSEAADFHYDCGDR